MWFGKMSFSWELDLLLFRHQECLIIILHFYNEAERAACCQFNYQVWLKTDSMFALIIKKKKTFYWEMKKAFYKTFIH